MSRVGHGKNTRKTGGGWRNYFSRKARVAEMPGYKEVTTKNRQNSYGVKLQSLWYEKYVLIFTELYLETIIEYNQKKYKELAFDELSLVIKPSDINYFLGTSKLQMLIKQIAYRMAMDLEGVVSKVNQPIDKISMENIPSDFNLDYSENSVYDLRVENTTYKYALRFVRNHVKEYLIKKLHKYQDIQIGAERLVEEELRKEALRGMVRSVEANAFRPKTGGGCSSSKPNSECNTISYNNNNLDHIRSEMVRQRKKLYPGLYSKNWRNTLKQSSDEVVDSLERFRDGNSMKLDEDARDLLETFAPIRGVTRKNSRFTRRLARLGRNLQQG